MISVANIFFSMKKTNKIIYAYLCINMLNYLISRGVNNAKIPTHF